MPSSVHSSDTEVSRLAMAAWATRTCAFDRANFLPPLRPRGLEPGHGAFADQIALELGECGEDPEHEAPGGGRGVDLGALAGEHAQAHAARGQLLDGVDEVGEVAPEAVELPHHEHVALSERAQAVLEPRTVAAHPGGQIIVEVLRVDAGSTQRVALEVERLGAVGLGDASVADSRVSQTRQTV